MIGSFDDDPAVSQMAAIGGALQQYGWSPRRAACGCPRCVEEAAAAPLLTHVPDADEDDGEDI